MSNNLRYLSIISKIKNYLRKIYILKPISYLVKALSYPWKGKGVILMYHRVLPDNLIKEDLNTGMAVNTSEFEKQIKILKSKYKIVSMDEFNQSVKKKKNHFLVTLTFDDGYKDNLTHALPILEKFQVPATIYITTRFLEGGDVWMWWYELKHEIYSKSKLNFEFKNFHYNFLLENYQKKEIVFKNLRKLFLDLESEEQIKLLEVITGNKIRKNYAEICLNKEDVINLDQNPLITIGSHSHNHLNLSVLEKEKLLYEVNQSTEILEKLLNHKIKHFSYPYGHKNQVSKRECNTIADLNFDTAVTTQAYAIKNCSNYLLPRIYVGNNTCEKTLMNHLSGFYNLTNKIF